MNYVTILSETSLFKGLPKATLDKLAAVAKEEQLSGSQELFGEGDEGNAMYVVSLGTVRVMKKNKTGEDEEVAAVGTGSFFGEMALVTDDHRRTATIIAREPTTLVRLERQDIEAICEKDASFARAFYHAVARALARRLAATSQDAAYYRAMWKARHS